MVAAGCLVGITGFSRDFKLVARPSLSNYGRVVGGLYDWFIAQNMALQKRTYLSAKTNGESIAITFENTMPDFSGNEWWLCLIAALAGGALILSLHGLRKSISKYPPSLEVGPLPANESGIGTQGFS